MRVEIPWLVRRRSVPINRSGSITGILLSVVLAGCFHAPQREAPSDSHAKATRVDLRDSSLIKSKLHDQYSEWKGTKYKIGGLSKSGIDCSGFVHVTFKTKLGIVLPRSTELQAGLGKNIARNQLRTGDLVFFKTGVSIRHVGVYLENGKFLHASTTLGVMISGLDEDYWKSAYWKAKRLEM